MKLSSLLCSQFAACACLAVCGFVATATRATTLAKMDLPSLARAAEIVVDVRFVDAQVRQEHSSIWTFAQFQVLDTLAGMPAANRITVRLPGGQIGHLRAAQLPGGALEAPRHPLVLVEGIVLCEYNGLLNTPTGQGRNRV